MPISDALLPEFDYEKSVTRKMLERVPAGKTDWKPHPKSMTLGRLAGHVAELPGWAFITITSDSLDMAPAGQPAFQPVIVNSGAEALPIFDKNVREARQALAAAGDADLMKPWSLLRTGQSLFTMPRIAVLRTWVMNHIIHHRAQLGVYLRLNDIDLPSTYGPSADEGRM